MLHKFILDNKCKEIKGIKFHLEQLALKDTLVSIDAIGMQTDIVETIIHKYENDVFCINNYQKHSLQKIKSLYSSMFQI